MMTVEAARSRLLEAVTPATETETLPLAQAAGRVLAEPVLASCKVPPMDNSAMDGYALRAADAGAGPLPVSARIVAGDAPAALAAGSAARIFTGAAIPAGADSVVMQERCRLEGGKLVIDGPCRVGDNIRRAGEDIAVGSRVLAPGQWLRPQDLGLAASVGVPALTVRRRLRLAVLTTGDELVTPGEALPPGRIYESNGVMLQALLQGLGCELSLQRRVPDRLDATRAALREAAAGADLVIASGGVSVGEEDHVKAAVQAEGALDLWKIAVKPGKPLAFGRLGTAGEAAASGAAFSAAFLGLPGNPVSLFVTFALFGAPLIRRLQGRAPPMPEPLRLPLAEARRSGGREEYLRVRVEDGRLQAFGHQGSGVLSSVAWADGLARIPADSALESGETVDFFPFQTLLG